MKVAITRRTYSERDGWDAFPPIGIESDLVESVSLNEQLSEEYGGHIFRFVIGTSAHYVDEDDACRLFGEAFVAHLLLQLQQYHARRESQEDE